MDLGFHNVATLSFVVMIETFVDETATPVAKLIQTACAAGVSVTILRMRFREKAQRRGLAQIGL